MKPIKLMNLRKNYGEKNALKNIHLTINPETFHCILGPNSSGKTTLFKVILGLISPDEGKIQVPDAIFGCSYQNPKFYGDLSVGENLEIFLRLAKKHDRKWVKRTIKLLGIEEVLDERAAELSAGYSKKLDLALSLIRRPDFLLLDEPLSNLDEKSASRFMEFLKKDSQELGSVVVFSHRIQPFTGLLDQMTILRNGEIIFDKLKEEFEKERDDRNLQSTYERLIR